MRPVGSWPRTSTSIRGRTTSRRFARPVNTSVYPWPSNDRAPATARTRGSSSVPRWPRPPPGGWAASCSPRRWLVVIMSRLGPTTACSRIRTRCREEGSAISSRYPSNTPLAPRATRSFSTHGSRPTSINGPSSRRSNALRPHASKSSPPRPSDRSEWWAPTSIRRMTRPTPRRGRALPLVECHDCSRRYHQRSARSSRSVCTWRSTGCRRRSCTGSSDSRRSTTRSSTSGRRCGARSQAPRGSSDVSSSIRGTSPFHAGVGTRSTNSRASMTHHSQSRTAGRKALPSTSVSTGNSRQSNRKP